MDILVYPHQIALLHWCIREWNQSLYAEHPDNLKVLSTLAPTQQSRPIAENSNCSTQRVIITTSHQWKVEAAKKELSAKMHEFFHAPKRVDEIAWLMQTNSDDVVDAPVLVDESTKQITAENVSNETMSAERAIRVTFQEESQVLFPVNATIQVVLKTDQGRKLEEHSIRSLRAGNIVLFIHGQQRQNLYELIVSRVHAHPSFALYLNLIQRWQEELIQCYRRSKATPEKILNQMKQHGSQLKTQQTIRLWLDGRVMCPKDPKDLQRIADVLDMSFVKQYQNQIARSASRLRGIHRGLSRKLNQWLQQEAVESTPEQINELIDPELGITFNDFQDALCLLTVKEIKLVEGSFLTSNLGQLSERTSYV